MRVLARGERRCGRLLQRGTDHEDGRGAVIDYERDLRRREPRVERHEDRAELRGGEQRLERGDVVGPQVGDAAPGADPRLGEGAGEVGAAPPELPVGQAAPVLGEGGGRGFHPGAPGGPGPDPVVGRVRCHAGPSPRARIAFCLRMSGLTSSLMSRAAKSSSHLSGVSSG